jgi:hypothetical protein
MLNHPDAVEEFCYIILVKNLTRKIVVKKCDNCRHPKEQQEVTKDMIQALQIIQLLKGKF